MSATPTERIENADLRIELDAETGAIVQVKNLRRDMTLVAGEPGPPWRILLEDGGVLERLETFALHRRADGADLRWTTVRGDVVSVTLSLDARESTIRLEGSLQPGAGSPPLAIEYPVVGGIGALAGNGDDDKLLHSYATGFLFSNPAALFGPDGEDGERGVLYSPYPEGFSGSTLQLMAYYVERRGGFSFAVEDATGGQKWLNFFADGSALRAVVAHGAADLDAALHPIYPVVLGALTEGTWTEAADRYKAWAVEQPWCSRGTLESRDDRPRWLHEDVGVVTFGINASHDRSDWLREMGRIAGTPVLHVLGPNWANAPQDYENHLPGGLADWFPTRLHPANVAAIREHGDRMVPFLFDLLFGRSGAEAEAGEAALQDIPKPELSFDAYAFPFLCPATAFARDLHRERDAQLAGEVGADAVYYDISANNVIKRCHSTAHGHPRGGGAFLVDAYRELYSEPVIPRGTELVNEVFTDRLDFYQARAEASPAAAFEGARFRDWIKDGRAEKVPLHAYVYHEYGPVRMDGWAKLSREQGDLFYWIGARVLVWGGLFELNYEFSPLETVDGHPEPLDEHYFPLPDHRYAIDPEKAAFVGELAAARTGPANPYLAYGTMLPALEIECPTVELDWFHYNCAPVWPPYEDSGRHTVRAVVHGAWRHGDAAAVVLVNVDRMEHTVRVPVDTKTLRLPPDGTYAVERVAGATRTTLAPLADGEAVTLTLPSRKVVLVEITPR